MARYRGVILDVDGTLVDSNDLHAQAWVDAFAEGGREVRFEKVRPLIGMGADNLLPALGLSNDDPLGARIAERRSAIFREQYLGRVRPFPGVRELLARIRERGLALAVASSAKEEELRELLKIAGADDLVGPRTSSDDADSSKPDPDIVEAAVAKLRLPPAEAVMLGDTPYDIEAARRAGVDTIAVRTGGWDDRGLSGAVATYDSAAHLLREFERSALA
jgi:HAD superfamily hydrolase (TIGR01509 family)